MVRGRRAGERQGLRGCGRRGRRREARLHRRRGHLDADQVRRRDRPGTQGLGLRHQPVLDHRGAQAGRRLLLAVLRRAQAVITTGGSKAAKATSLADLKDLKIGAQVGTTSYDAILSAIDPSQKPAVYNSNDDAKQALENGQVDAIVTDLPTAFYITAAELSNGKIVGQLPSDTGEQEQFGLVLDKGSPLTTCVSQAVDALRADGTLDQLVDEWLSRAGGAPELN